MEGYTIIRMVLLVCMGIGLYYLLLYYSDVQKYRKLKIRKEQKKVNNQKAKRYGIIFALFIGILVVIGFYCIKCYVWRMK